jgi:1-acyl-sn-glycerol-3-phosphate acyltransferase
MMRLLAVVPVLALFTIVLIPVQWLAVRFNWPLRRSLPVFYHHTVCRIVGLRVHVVGERMTQHPLMIVSNHASWADISVITSVVPVVFIAKLEIARWPVFGLLAKLQRSVFVDRNRRHKTGDVNAQIAQRLAEGDPVVLFGEGTSNDGNRVLPFRTALIGAARDALAEAEHTERVWIQPLSIAYTSLLGLPLGREHRPRIAWYGDMDLLPHLGAILRTGALDVTLTWGTPVPYDETSSRKEIARDLERSVRRMTTLALRGRPAVPDAEDTQASEQPR